MNTNAITGWIGKVQGYIDAVQQWPSWALTALVLLVGCYIWMRMPRVITLGPFKIAFHNEALWALVPVCGMGLNQFLAPPHADHSFRAVRGWNGILGFLVGFVVIAAFPWVLQNLIPKIPWGIGAKLAIPDQDGQHTGFFVNPNPPEPPKTP